MKLFETFRENLSYADRMAENVRSLQDAQYAQMADLAMQYWRGTPDTDRIAALYLTGDPETDPAELTPAEGELCTPQFARFCRQFGENLPPFGLLEVSRDQTAEEDTADESEEGARGQAESALSGSRTAYMQNGYTDKAWRKFVDVLPDMTAEYFASYPAVCEEVYNGRCRYCILPLYTSKDGRLVSLRKLIGKYDLKICMETEVEMADESVMRFALLRRKLLTGGEKGIPGYLELSAVLPEGGTAGSGSAGALIAACEALGAAVTAVYTIPLEYGDRMQEFCLELDLTGADFAGLTVFLEASQLRYTAVGLYDIV